MSDFMGIRSSFPELFHVCTHTDGRTNEQTNGRGRKEPTEGRMNRRGMDELADGGMNGRTEG
jgi:hypothetical protein